MAWPEDVPGPPGAAEASQGTVAPATGKRRINVTVGSRVFPVDIPANMSPDEAYASVRDHVVPQLKQYVMQEQEKSASAAAAPESIPINLPLLGGQMTIPGSAVVAAGRGYDLVKAGLQRLNRGVAGLMPESIRAKGASDAELAQQEAQQQADQQSKAQTFAPLQRAEPWSTGIGQAVGVSAPLAAASMALTPAAAYATPAAAFVNAVTQGAVGGAIPWAPSWQQTGRNALYGGLLGGAMQAPFSALQSFAGGPSKSITPPQAAAAEGAQGFGMQPFPSQVTGSPSLSNFEKILNFMPFAGRQMQARRAANQQAGNEAVLGTLGSDASYGTSNVLGPLKREIGSGLNAIENSGATISFKPEHIAALQAFRDQAASLNSPNAELIRTLDRLIAQGRTSASLGTSGEQVSPAIQAQLETQGLVQGPQPFTMGQFSDIQSDLANLAARGKEIGKSASIAGQINNLLYDVAFNGLPGNMGATYRDLKQRYGALMAADSAFDTSGNVSFPKLSQQLTSGPDVLHYDYTSNPRIQSLADIARTATSMVRAPGEGSDTAAKLAQMEWLSKGIDAAGLLGLATLGGVGAPSGMTALGALGGAALPLAMGNYAAKAYLSPGALQWAQQGLPWLTDIMKQSAPFAASALPAAAASQTQ